MHTNETVTEYWCHFSHSWTTLSSLSYTVYIYYRTIISEGSDILVPLSLFVQSDSRFVLQRDLDILWSIKA